MPLLRIRTKDGMERMSVDDGATLHAFRQKIESDLGVPMPQQV